MASKYKSPQHKLVKFFEQSRDAWKARSCEYYSQLNNANNKLRYHQNKSKELKSEKKYLLTKIAELEKALSESKKKIKLVIFSQNQYMATLIH